MRNVTSFIFLVLLPKSDTDEFLRRRPRSLRSWTQYFHWYPAFCSPRKHGGAGFDLFESRVWCKEVRFPASLLEPNGPLSVTQLKTRLMEIRGWMNLWTFGCVWAERGMELVCWCGHQLNYNSTNVKEPLG